MSFLLETLRLGLTNLWLHKLRSLLTALGIIIGVGAVVAIAAYGEGSKQAVLREIKMLGANNIILRSERPDASEDATDDNRQINVYGLRLTDLVRIRDGQVRPIEAVVPLKRVATRVWSGVRAVPNAAVFGTTPELLGVAALKLETGRI